LDDDDGKKGESFFSMRESGLIRRRKHIGERGR